jgi:hypothetical protein
VLSPSIWLAAAQALPGELIELGRYLQNWSTAVQDSHGWSRVGVALLILTVLAMAMAMLWFGWQRRTTDVAGTRGRFSKALSSFGVFLCLALATPLLTITLLEATEVRMIEISYGFIAGVVIAAFGRAVALGVFAPDAPQRRLIALDDLTARSLANHLIWGTRALGALLVVLAVHKALAAPAAMTIATNMLFALVSGVLLLHLLLSHRYSGEKTLPLARWLRGLGWLVVGVIAIALIAGYPTFAAFVAARVISDFGAFRRPLRVARTRQRAVYRAACRGHPTRPGTRRGFRRRHAMAGLRRNPDLRRHMCRRDAGGARALHRALVSDAARSARCGARCSRIDDLGPLRPQDRCAKHRQYE